MSGETLIWANRSTDLNNHISSRKQHHSTIDQARAFAAELGPDLELALDQLSNKTALVLHAYVLALHQEGHSYDEIEEIRDAMKKYFDDTFRCFGTNWQFLPDQDEASVGDGGMDKDERSGEWIGNPAFDTAFVSLMQELKDQEERSNARPAKRRTAIGYQDITNLMQHLQKSEAIEAEGLARCLFFQAFAATAFTLWLTFDEVLKLKLGDVHFRQPDLDGPLWLSVTVPFRNSNPIDRALANVYRIYPQPEEPHVCCATHLHAWIQQLELKAGRQLQADEYLFPNLANDDQTHLEQPFSVTQVSDLLSKYAADAGIMDHRYNQLDTHCFRRGGAQYRLFHIQDQWPFKAIKWWGGWSEREPAEKILEYLLDDSQYETSFGDIMSPNGSQSREYTAVTRLPIEMLVTRECFKSTIRSAESRHAAVLAKVEKEVQEIRQQNIEFCQESTEWRGAITLQLEKVVHMLSSQVPDPPRRLSQKQPNQSQGLLQRPKERPLEQQSQKQSPHQHPPDPSKRTQSQLHPVRLSNPPRQPHPRKRSQERPSKQKRQTDRNIPAISHWMEAIMQWNEGDPDNGLDVPLSDWTPVMRHKNATYYDRKLVVKEFESFGRSEAKMRKVYGESMNGLGKLTKAIRSRHKRQKQGVAKSGHEGEQEEEEEDKEEEDEEQEKEEEKDEEGPEVPWPNVPKLRDWKQAITQWEIGDPGRGFKPVSTWPAKWKRARRTQTVYWRRRTIAEEFAFCGRDEDRMLQLHGAAMERVDELLVSINRHRRLRRNEEAKTVVKEEEDELENKLEEEKPLIKKRKVVMFG